MARKKRYKSVASMAARLLKPKGGLVLSGTPGGAMIVRVAMKRAKVK